METASVVREHQRSHAGKELQTMMLGPESEDGFMAWSAKTAVPQGRQQRIGVWSISSFWFRIVRN